MTLPEPNKQTETRTSMVCWRGQCGEARAATRRTRRALRIQCEEHMTGLLAARTKRAL